ncbi:hypothetical protein GLAREA_01483 [Glarea lozoyensis ATCC 20868]|uniref:Extracellular membrane protein CFEM domain-containing protein n=1 Tax=Glarea lozoyensis (strain ATCC 20868 / MF5171) TaxID=1116229 RepID=S3D0J8_GLAL2|nr:uncharacterized protein GLAREA_01483 [Glarea lozoyensis ATCC 20868]EPE25571.1 hypothetical protein GLAREA_01483 [Glarea lozoyensis ATCC 20868]
MAQVTLTRQSIMSASGYKDMRPCAQQCFHSSGLCSDDLLGGALGCQAGCSAFALNSCYCRPDLQPLAAAYLPTCITSECTLGGDLNVEVTGALSVYGGYCASQGLTAAQITNPSVTETPRPSPGNGTPPPAATVTSIVYVKVNSGISLPLPNPVVPVFISVRDALAFGSVKSLTLTFMRSSSPSSSSRSTSNSVGTSTSDRTTPATRTVPPGMENAITTSLPIESTVSPSSSNNDNGLSRADKIAIGLGTSIPLLALLLAYLTYRLAWLTYKEARRANEDKNRDNELVEQRPTTFTSLFVP